MTPTTLKEHIARIPKSFPTIAALSEMPRLVVQYRLDDPYRELIFKGYSTERSFGTEDDMVEFDRLVERGDPRGEAAILSVTGQPFLLFGWPDRDVAPQRFLLKFRNCRTRDTKQVLDRLGRAFGWSKETQKYWFGGRRGWVTSTSDTQEDLSFYLFRPGPDPTLLIIPSGTYSRASPPGHPEYDYYEHSSPPEDIAGAVAVRQELEGMLLRVEIDAILSSNPA